MRYHAGHKQETRARVLQEAAKAIRAEGPDRVGVAGVMAKAGLTHGGFYAHFKSKDDLVAAAIDQMFHEAQGRFAEAVADKPPAEGLAAYINVYLSRSRRDARGAGCPITALCADLPRMEGAARARYGQGVEALRIALAGHLALLGRDAPDALASSTLSELVGALSLTRAAADPEQSDLILRTSRRALKARLGLETAP